MKFVNTVILGFCAITICMSADLRFEAADNSQKDKPPYYLSDNELDETLNVKSETKTSGDYVRVLYFHRTPGCQTCQTMSRYIYETILKYYSEEAKKKQVILRYYDFENPQNEKLVETFKIAAPSLILIQGQNGKEIKAKKLDKIWPLAGDKTAFIKYVRDEIDRYLKPNTEMNENK